MRDATTDRRAPNSGRPRRTGAILLPVLLGAVVLSCSAQAQVAPFEPADGSPFPAGDEPQDIVVCDLDADGNPDALTANQGSSDVSVLLGDGTGGFQAAPGSPFASEIAAHLIVCADLTGDGHLDVAVTSHHDHDIVLLAGDGRGGLAAGSPRRFPAHESGEPHNHGLLAVDLDGDGALDLATTNQEVGSASVLHGDGRGGFTPASGSPFAVGEMPYLLAAGDLDGDGRPDLAVPNARDDDVTLLRQQADGSYLSAPGSDAPVGSQPYFAGLADLNGDSRLDLVTSHAETSRLTIRIADADGDLGTVESATADAENRGYKVRFGDVNADGHVDLVTSGMRAVAVLLGDGRGTFAPAQGSPYETGAGAWGTALADVDHDGKLDILTSNADDNSVSVLLAN